MLRFVVLRHEIETDSAHSARGSHWDLMLEDDGQLLTWALPRLPEETDTPIRCQQLDDHRIAYLDYEGPISNNRGSVKRWDRGTFQWKQRRPNELSVVLEGEKLRGTLTLIRNSEAKGTTDWSCVIEPKSQA